MKGVTMTNATTTVVMVLAACGSWTTACRPDGEETEATGVEDDAAAQEEHDRRACLEALRDFPQTKECRFGFTPQVLFGGSVALAEDVVVPVCGDAGGLIDFDAIPGVDLVGYDVTQNSVCSFGCFSACGPRVNGCFVERLSNGHCGVCRQGFDRQACEDFVQICRATEDDDVDVDDQACGAPPRG